MIQNSGLCNAVSALTSLTDVFRISLLLICTHLYASRRTGRERRAATRRMGRVTGRMLDTMERLQER
jgi:sulfopyruvate decarboxylase TPP-binding subunit